MEWTVDLAFQELAKHEHTITSVTAADNEADTRLRAIDTMFFDVLGWEKTSVEAERYCRVEGFADYVFLRRNVPTLVLEAKRNGVAFTLPERREYEDRPYAFGLLARECRDPMNALQQALGYAATLVIPGTAYLFRSGIEYGVPRFSRFPSPDSPSMEKEYVREAL